MKMFLLVVTLLIVGCSKNKYESVQVIDSCLVERTEDGTKINCPGNEEVFIPNAKDGVDGADGADGSDGINGSSPILNIIDPCGDGPGHDEIIVELDGGQFIAWFVDVGLVVLQPSVLYRTTDAQGCRFRIQPGVGLVEE